MIRKISLAAASVMAVYAASNEGTLETIDVIGVSKTAEQSGSVKDIVEKTEVVGRREIEQAQASTLVEAIDKSPGVNVTTNCSVCGIKRVMLNGMQGEHTTVLEDGVPFHSTVSSYYGMDGLTMADVETVEIARGSGASLTAPEAIGGTVNIVSRRATRNGAEFDMAAGNQGYRNLLVSGEGIAADKKTGLIVTAGYSNMDRYDRDKNGVSESPKLENQSFSATMFHELPSGDLIDVKVAHVVSRVMGGAMVSKGAALASDATPTFIGGNDVRHPYDMAHALGIFEAVTTTRDEGIAKYSRILSPRITLKTTAGLAVARQDSLYEGETYNNKDTTLFGDIRADHLLGESHLLTYGLDLKRERMRSDSTLFVSSADSDAFNYQALGGYIQDSWIPNDRMEIDMAVRASRIVVNYIGQTAQGNEVDASLAVPRMLLRYDHDGGWTSRLSAGQGYRAPLTFFESDHGLIGSGGFGMAIDRLERSDNVSYALSYARGGLSMTASAAYTRVKNLAYIDESSGTPVLRNFGQTVGVRNGDLVAGYALTPTLSVSGSYELYSYDGTYKNHLAIAAVEQRARMGIDWDLQGWDLGTTATWIGPRNLEPYGYGDRYNDESATSPKRVKSPAFMTVDLKVVRQLDRRWSVYAGVKNLFDMTQTAKESPLFYDAAGNIDTVHIWGPLRGRTGYVGVKAVF